MDYKFDFNNGQCSMVKNLDKDGGWLYYAFSRNDTMYQKWKMKSMSKSDMFKQNNSTRKHKGGHRMRMGGRMNGTRWNMSMGNMSTSVNFNVDGNNVNGSMQAKNGSWKQKMNISGNDYELSWNMSGMKNKT